MISLDELVAIITMVATGISAVFLATDSVYILSGFSLLDVYIVILLISGIIDFIQVVVLRD